MVMVMRKKMVLNLMWFVERCRHRDPSSRRGAQTRSYCQDRPQSTAAAAAAAAAGSLTRAVSKATISPRDISRFFALFHTL